MKISELAIGTLGYLYYVADEVQYMLDKEKEYPAYVWAQIYRFTREAMDFTKNVWGDMEYIDGRTKNYLEYRNPNAPIDPSYLLIEQEDESDLLRYGRIGLRKWKDLHYDVEQKLRSIILDPETGDIKPEYQYLIGQDMVFDQMREQNNCEAQNN